MTDVDSINRDTLIENDHPLISIIIINFNGLKYFGKILDDCISSILINEYSNIEIIFVDNGSSDSSREHIHNAFGYDERIRIVALDKNRGTVVAKKIGIRESKGDFVFLMNNDIILKKDTLTKMVEALKNNPDIGILGCKLVYPCGGIQSEGEPFDTAAPVSLLHVISPSIWKRRIKTLRRGDLNLVDWVYGAATMMRKNSLNLYDEEYFMYNEEVDLAYKVKKIGYNVACLTACEAIHYRNATARHFSTWKRDLVARNELLFICKNFPPTQLAWSVVIFAISIIDGLLFSLLKLNKTQLLNNLSKIKAFFSVKKDAKSPGEPSAKSH